MRIPTKPSPVFDAATDPAGSGKDLGNLPDWDLSDLYAAPDAPEVTRDLDRLKTLCADFAERYEGKLADLDAQGMLTCVTAHEEIDRIAGRLMSYAGLRYYQVTTDGERAQFLQNCQEKLTDYTSDLYTFTWAGFARKGGGAPRGGERRGQGGKPQGGKPKGKGPRRDGDRGKGGPGGKPKTFSSRPPKKDKPIDPDNPFAQALMGLKDKK